MSGGTIGPCPDCGRLLIVGQSCTCAEPPRMSCDCTYDSNHQIIGPACFLRIRDAWAKVLQR